MKAEAHKVKRHENKSFIDSNDIETGGHLQKEILLTKVKKYENQTICSRVIHKNIYKKRRRYKFYNLLH